MIQAAVAKAGLWPVDADVVIQRPFLKDHASTSTQPAPNIFSQVVIEEALSTPTNSQELKKLLHQLQVLALDKNDILFLKMVQRITKSAEANVSESNMHKERSDRLKNALIEKTRLKRQVR